MHEELIMLMSNASQGLFSTHTFGRNMDLQQGELPPSQQMGETAPQTTQQCAGSLPDDFDQIVRNVGEW